MKDPAGSRWSDAVRLGYLRTGIRVVAVLLIFWPVVIFVPLFTNGAGSGRSYEPGTGLQALMTLDFWQRYKTLLIVALATASAGAILWVVSALLPDLVE